MTNKDRQAATGTSAAGATSADAIKQAATTDDNREFTRLYRKASPRGRLQIGHLIQALYAGDQRHAAAWAYHWAAFVAINPRVALRAIPALRHIAQAAGVCFCVVVLLALATGCTDSSGAASLRATAQAAGVQISVASTATQTPTPTDQPAQVGATVTPDMQPQSFAASPAQVVEVESTQTPQPVQIGAPCDAAQPMPTVALDATDQAAGVVMRGQWQPCAYQTAIAVQVQP